LTSNKNLFFLYPELPNKCENGLQASETVSNCCLDI
jgi:hypothetical protein